MVRMPRLLFAALSLLLLAPAARADATVALPLFNLSKDRSVDWVGESVAENIIEALHAEGLVTLDRNDRAEACQRLSLRANASLSRASVVKIADELDVLNTGHVEKGARVAREGEAGNHRGGWDVRILLAGNSPFQG